jgi:hypothetical protein
MTVSGTNVTLNVVFNGSPTGEMTKIAYPSAQGSEGYFRCGNFDLGELLGAVPVVGPMLKTGFNLITSLIGDSGGPSGVATPGTVTTYVPHRRFYIANHVDVHRSQDRFSTNKKNTSERLSHGYKFKFTSL